MIDWLFGKKKSNPIPAGKNDFISLASHELRSPLSIIKWYTEILLDGDAGPLTEDQRKYLTVIEASNQRAIDLVRSLLNVSRLDLDTFSVSPSAIVFPKLISEIVSILSEKASQNNVTIECAQEGVIQSVMADVHISELVLKQVLLNAILFSKNGGLVKINTTLGKRGEFIGGKSLEEESVVVSVTDNGIGIPEKDYDIVFSKMMRGSNIQDSDTTGPGLGLYISKKVMTVVGGDIWFTSQEKEGSTFYVAFPTSGMKSKPGRTVLE
jgi:signal transduction histidine kinase